MSLFDALRTVPQSAYLWFALASVSVVLVATMFIAIRALRQSARLRRQVDELRRDQQRQSTSILALHGAMKVISEDVINHGQHQSSVTRTLERLTDRQSELRLRDVDEGLYSQAIALIRQGRSRQEVRKLCALSESETDLLFSLHGQGVRSSQLHQPSRRDR